MGSPPVSVSGAGASNGGDGATGSGTGGTTMPWDDPSAGTGGSGAGGPPPAGTGGVVGGGVGGGEPVAGQVFDAGSDPARNMVTAGTICTRLAQIQCAGEQYCCEAPGRDRVACEFAQRTACAEEGLVDMVAADAAAGFDAAHAATAFAQLEQLASTCDPTVASWGATTQGFIGIFKGTVGPGGDCSPPGLIPDKTEAAVALTSCNTIETSACLPDSSNPTDAWTCAGKGAGGAPCLTDLNCQTGLYCPNEALDRGGFGLGTCAPRLADGSPCSAGNHCASLYCVGGTCAAVGTQAAYCLGQQL